MLDLHSYLVRINYSGPTNPSVETLRAIHHAHLQAVQFENLDISLGRKIVTDEDAILNKIVVLHRGGFCYELNGAFAALLRALGFRVTLLSARVARQGGGEGAEFDHMALQVDLNEPWLADVGFGDSFLDPLRLTPDIEQTDPAATFRLMQSGERLQLERSVPDGRWRRQYSFTVQPRSLADFAGMCHYHQISPESHFTQNRICTRATAEGRITLSEMRLVVASKGNREEHILSTEDERNEMLLQHFGITL
jgi:N-hydroxyarylamine O-acetyltransferase